MKRYKLFAALLLASLLLCGCAREAYTNTAGLLTVDDMVDISLTAPEGSGSSRALTLRYMDNGEEKTDTLEVVRRVDIAGYDDEAREQVITAPTDENGDNIADLIIYREFWFPDIDVSHPSIPEWPTVYEYDTEKGFVVASARHKDYFKAFAEKFKAALKEDPNHTYAEDKDARLLMERLVYAAECIADGSFVPRSDFKGGYYEDVYELTKDMRG